MRDPHSHFHTLFHQMWIEQVYEAREQGLDLKDLCNANACWLVLIYNTLIITNVTKRLFKYVPYILL